MTEATKFRTVISLLRPCEALGISHDVVAGPPANRRSFSRFIQAFRMRIVNVVPSSSTELIPGNLIPIEEGMMNIEHNKKVVSEFLSRFSNSDIVGALEVMSDDATWWIAGKAGLLPAAGTQSKEQMARLFHRMANQLTDGLRMTVKSMTAEGDRVAVEVESYGELKNGRAYNQEYHMLMVIRDGKISAVREYLDTQHVFAVWFES